jgi:hypothetical protein
MNKEPTPALIPHEKFHTGIWLLSVTKPGWYYFLEKKSHNDIENPLFLESVDTPLREMVSLLHKRGIKTTPSCSGHHKSKSFFEKVFEQLQIDKKEIRSSGLVFKDIESGRIYIYKNEQYSLPWSRREFLNKILSYQQHGIIGIKASGNIRTLLLKIRIPSVKVEEKDSIIFIQTIEKDNAGIYYKWKLVTKAVKNILENEPVITESQHRVNSLHWNYIE